MGWVLLLSLRFKSPGVHKWQCSKSINIVLREYYWQLRWPRKKPLDRRSMIKASMVTDCRLGMYTTVASGGSERGHNAMFLVYGAGAHPSRMGDFRESYNVKPFPWSRDTGAQKRRWVSEWRRRDAHVPGLTLTEHGLTQKSKCNEGFSQERENWQKKGGKTTFPWQLVKPPSAEEEGEMVCVTLPYLQRSFDLANHKENVPVWWVCLSSIILSSII